MAIAGLAVVLAWVVVGCGDRPAGKNLSWAEASGLQGDLDELTRYSLPEQCDEARRAASDLESRASNLNNSVRSDLRDAVARGAEHLGILLDEECSEPTISTETAPDTTTTSDTTTATPTETTETPSTTETTTTPGGVTPPDTTETGGDGSGSDGSGGTGSGSGTQGPDESGGGVSADPTPRGFRSRVRR